MCYSACLCTCKSIRGPVYSFHLFLCVGRCAPGWRCMSVRSPLRRAPCWRDMAVMKMESTASPLIYEVQIETLPVYQVAVVFECSEFNTCLCLCAVYHALYLEDLTAAELIRKMACVCSLPLGTINQVYRQGPTGIHILLSDQVLTHSLTHSLTLTHSHTGPLPLHHHSAVKSSTLSEMYNWKSKKKKTGDTSNCPLLAGKTINMEMNDMLCFSIMDLMHVLFQDE